MNIRGFPYSVVRLMTTPFGYSGSHEQYLEQVILSNEHNGQKGCNKHYFSLSLCSTRTVKVIQIDTSHCISLISLTTV